MYPNDGSREVGREECLRLLATAPIGRIVHTLQALPALLPRALVGGRGMYGVPFAP